MKQIRSWGEGKGMVKSSCLITFIPQKNQKVKSTFLQFFHFFPAFFTFFHIFFKGEGVKSE
jgi:hypothetical protein